MGLFKDCGCGCGGRKQQEKFMASIMSALLFFLIANPETFILVRRIFGNWVASATGYPTMLGLVLHSVVFMLIVWGMMNIKRENEDGEMEPPVMGAGELLAFGVSALTDSSSSDHGIIDAGYAGPVLRRLSTIGQFLREGLFAH